MKGAAPSGLLKADTLIIGLAFAALVGVFLYIFANSQQVLRRSPAGFDGLTTWLRSNEMPARSFTGGWSADPASIGLRVLPLVDTKPDSPRETPGTKQELLLQNDEYDQRLQITKRKAEIVPTLLVLPKWRSGMRLTGLAHPALLLPPDAAGNLLRPVLENPSHRVSIIPRPFTDFAVTGKDGTPQTARLYVAQVFTAEGCEPLVGEPPRVVLADCPLPGSAENRALVLSDPDLINNHGLRLGDNALIIKDILEDRANGKTVLVDYSTSVWLFDKLDEVKRERTWEDLLQFFAYPFSLLWISGAFLMGLILWRAGVRFGPIRHEATFLGASKTTANKARARLMRLTGQDGAMIRDYANTRVTAVIARHLGPGHPHDRAAVLGLARRRRPDLVERLEAALLAIARLPDEIGSSAAIEHVTALEEILEQLDHDT